MGEGGTCAWHQRWAARSSGWRKRAGGARGRVASPITSIIERRSSACILQPGCPPKTAKRRRRRRMRQDLKTPIPKYEPIFSLFTLQFSMPLPLHRVEHNNNCFAFRRRAYCGGTKGLASGFSAEKGGEPLRESADPSAGDAAVAAAAADLGPRPAEPATEPCM